MRALYCRTLRALGITAVACVGILVTMSDHAETAEPWEFVPVVSHAVQ